MFVVPDFFGVIVTVPLLNDAVATVVSLLLLILNAPLVFVVAVNVPLAVGYVNVPLALFNVTWAMVHR